MKKMVFFILCCIISIGSNSQNLVLNSGFETWSKTDKPISWTNTQGCLKDSVFVVSGSYSCRQEGTTTSRDLGQKFVVKPSTQYRFSFFYKTHTDSTGNGSRVWCSWLDNNRTGISNPVLHSVFLKSDGWRKYEASVTSPDNAGYFYLLVRTLPNSVTYWDDFILEEDIVSGEKETMMPKIKVYPNPAHNYLITSNIYQLQQIDILTLTGTVVWSEQFHGEEEVTIPVSGLRAGIYIVKVRANGKITNHKFIKD